MEIRKTILTPNKREAMSVGNLVFRSIYDFRTTEEDLKQTHLELGETEHKKTASLLKLKEKLMGDKDFYYRLDDEYLLRYLRCRKLDVQKTYDVIRKFYIYRKERPDLFEISLSLDNFLRKDIMRLLPYRTEQGYLILWGDINNWRVDEISIRELITAMHAVADVVTMHPCMQVNGYIGLWDFGGVTVKHFVHLSHPRVKTYLHSFMRSYPVKIKRIIIFNCNSILRGFYSAFRYLLTQKIADRMILLGSDVKELHQYLNPRILPKVHGGCIETSECSLVQYIKDNLPYIEYERSFGTYEHMKHMNI